MKKKFQKNDLERLRYLSWPALAEDGKKAAWVTRKGNREDGIYRGEIDILDLKNRSRIHIGGKGTRKQPRFLKDSNYLLYLSDETGYFQIYIQNLNTGAAYQLTTLRCGVVRYDLNEEENHLAFEAVVWPEMVSEGTVFREMDEEERTLWEADLEYRPYYAEDLTYKMDEWSGMRKGEYSHIGVVKLHMGAIKQKLEKPFADSKALRKENDFLVRQYLFSDFADMEAVFPSWSHDGTMIAFYGYPYHGAKGREAELFVCMIDGTKLQRLTENIGLYPDHAPLFTPDDKELICMGFPTFEDGSCIMLPYRVPLEEKGAVALLPVGMNEEENEIRVCHGVAPMIAGRTEMGENPRYFRISEDGQWLYFLSGMHGKTGIYRAMLTDPKVTEKIFPEGENAGKDILSFTFNDRQEVLWLGADAYHPAELFWGKERLTFENQWLEDYELGKVEEVWTKSRDQKAELQWFLVHPAGEKADESHPGVLYIKGGPTTMYTDTFWHEFQALSGAGFTVIYGNPRGSVGFGREFCKDGICWRDEAMNDLEDMVLDGVKRGYVNLKSLGVTGGSYGGYMTNKLLGRTELFRAGVTQRCLVNPASSYGTGDMGFVSAGKIPENFRMLDYLTDRAKGNPLTFIDQFRVPLLILHGMKDYRCGFEQAEQLFTAMKERHPDIPVRLVAFPGENHGVSREGKLYHQICHLSEMVNWFVKYLNMDGDKHEEKSTAV